MNLAEILFTTAARHSPRRAITDVRSGRSVSYGQLAREAERVAAFLKAEGVEPGQRIGLLAPNDLAYLPAAFGLLAAGACFVPLASNLTPTEIAEIFREVQLNGCFSWPKAAPLPSAPGHADASARRAVVKGGECDGYAFQWIDRGARGPDGVRQAERRVHPLHVRDDGRGARASCCPTKRPPRASRRPIACSSSAKRIASSGCCPSPITSRSRSRRTSAPAPTSCCAPTPCRKRSWTEPAASARACCTRRPCTSSAWPTSGRATRSRAFALTLSTAAPISTAVMERFESVVWRSGRPGLRHHRGGSAVHQPGHRGPAPGLGGPPRSRLRRRGVLGRRHALAPEAMGEIAVRGDGLFSAYYSPWRLREQVENDGWFLTGDLGFLDRSGALSPERPEESPDPRRRAEVLSRGSRGLHQPVPGDQGISGVQPAARAHGRGALRGDRDGAGAAATSTP